MNNLKNRIKNVLQKGAEFEGEKEIDDYSVFDGIETLKLGAIYHPEYTLQQMAVCGSEEMMAIGAAVLLTCASESFLKRNEIKINIKEILMHQNPEQLALFVDIIRSRMLNKGLGSRTQKIVRGIMETWNCHTLHSYLKEFKEEMFKLINLIHPRYKGKRGEIVTDFLYDNH